MAIHHRRASGTRWLIKAEAGPLSLNAWAVKQRDKRFLQRLLVDIWGHESVAGSTMPKLHFGRGMLLRRGSAYKDMYVSYCQGRLYIELARGQRNALVLVHEVTHALGYTYHTERFIRRYFRLLARYARYDRQMLIDLARGRGIEL